jgi:hypothetical protein
VLSEVTSVRLMFVSCFMAEAGWFRLSRRAASGERDRYRLGV